MNPDERTRILLLIVVFGLILVSSILTGVLADNDDSDGPLSVRTDDDWYRKGERIVYNITAPAGSKFHVMLYPPDGGAFKEVYSITDENGTYENAFLSGQLWVGAWTIEVNDYNNHTVRVKVDVVMDSGHIQDLWLSIGYQWDEFQGFVWEMMFRFFGLGGFAILFLMIWEHQKNAEQRGDVTLIDKTWMSAKEVFTFAHYKVGLSKKGKQDAHLMLKQAFNNLRRSVGDKEKLIRWYIQEIKHFDDIHIGKRKVGPKMKDFVLKRYRTAVFNLHGDVEILNPELERVRKDLIESYVREGLWYEGMNEEEKNRLLYAGEDRMVAML